MDEEKLSTYDVERQLEEKETLIREMHHRVKNNLQIIISMLELQKQHMKSTFAFDAITESQQRIAVMASIHETLFQSESMRNVRVIPFIDSLLRNIKAFHSQLGRVVETTVEIEDESLPMEAAVPFGLILNELVTNAYLHGFAGKESGAIHIEFFKQEKYFQLLIKDNGIGISKLFKYRTTDSMGLTIVQALVKQLNGRFDMRRKNGTICQLEFARL